MTSKIKKTRKSRGPYKALPENLLITRYPELALLWDIPKNIGIDVNKISHSSCIIVAWKCPNGNKEHDYKLSVASRTKLNHKGELPGCRKCYNDNLSFQDRTIVNAHINQYVQTQFSTEIGDETELYVENLLTEMNCYQKVKSLGGMGADSDIRVTYQNKNYYLQVKTLLYLKDNTYYTTISQNYPDNMLMIFVDKERKRYALDFAINIKTSSLALPFDSTSTKYKDIMFTNLNKFKRKLKDLLIHSCTEIKFSETIYKEYLMLKRFKVYCRENNIIYVRNKTNGNVVDGTINGHRFQAKFASLNSSTTTYTIKLHKSYGSLNGQKIHASCKIGDFDFLIIEVGGIDIDEHKYETNFCIIPEKILIEQNILRSDTCDGKRGFPVCFPDSIQNQWTQKYWNNIPIEIFSNT